MSMHKISVRQARKKARMTQVDVCLECRFSPWVLSHIENGRRSASAAEREKIAEAIGFLVDEIKWPGTEGEVRR